MKIVFMGTPDFARDSLEAIYNAGHDILAVVLLHMEKYCQKKY